MSGARQETENYNFAVRAVRSLIAVTVAKLDAIGTIILFAISAALRITQRPFRWRELIVAMEFVGVGSLPIVLVNGVFTGMVFAIQTSVAFEIFNAKSLIGGSVAMAMVRELAPSLTALMVAGRVGSAMCTELGTMRATEQIDALETMAVDPVHYLITPRLIACTVMMPLLCVGFNAVALIGAYVVATGMLGVDHAMFFSRIYEWVDPEDILMTLVKALHFGVVIGAIACHNGYFASGGSRGVGLATTQTVVMSSVTVLVVDYLITTLWLG